jgi:hypothetical protein
MRLYCYLSGGCHFEKIHEEWLPPDKQHQFTRLYRIEECPWCHDTRAIITSPEIADIRMTLPRRWLDNGRPQEETS